MLSPEDLIGQKVWLEVPRDSDFPNLDPHRVKAVITQPTSPPWFYARYEDPPAALREPGRWISLYEAEQAYFFAPVLEDYDFADDSEEDIDYEDEYRLH
ncbi:hypothetical protein [Lyngbya confervoides]|uniref:Uncharacterized protein n=1 Tax=Lyngbya confervoides BDU141951 TaxID=1574623 RepID=A0ABD4SZV0_9CYAN|nr:hypothetical protein [Lyngbya confervoides]MCM1981809.1 hypothetical protein [Lyngbya confervoides BDU141951]